MLTELVESHFVESGRCFGWEQCLNHRRELVSNYLTVSFGAFIFELTEHPRRDRNLPADAAAVIWRHNRINYVGLEEALVPGNGLTS